MKKEVQVLISQFSSAKVLPSSVKPGGLRGGKEMQKLSLQGRDVASGKAHKEKRKQGITHTTDNRIKRRQVQEEDGFSSRAFRNKSWWLICIKLSPLLDAVLSSPCEYK